MIYKQPYCFLHQLIHFMIIAKFVILLVNVLGNNYQ